MDKEQKKYDIFISYRRLGGSDYARTIQQALEKQYSVFLDFDELKDGVFDQRIMDAISNSSIFLLILTKGALDRCVNENDWVRQEILHASKCRCHIVPVTIVGSFEALPSNLPEDIRSVIGIHQFSELQMKTLFKASIEQLISDRIAPYVNQNTQDKVGAEIHIESDCDCELFKFKEFLGTLNANDDFVIYLKPGKYRFKFVSCIYPDIKVDMTYNLEPEKFSDIIDVALKKQVEERKSKEKEETENKRKSIQEICNNAIEYFNSNAYEKAFSLFQNAANEGNDIALYYLGLIYENGFSKEKNQRVALDYYRKAADAGNLNAIQYFLTLFESGSYSNIKDVISWLNKAAIKRVPWAYYKLGTLYSTGMESTKDIDKALDFFRQAAQLGDSDAQFHLGEIYHKDNNCKANIAEALKWYQMAAENNHSAAQYVLGDMYELGKGVITNYEKAVYWYTESANQGHKDAQFSLGKMYEQGKGVQRNIKKAITLYIKSDTGLARIRLGFIYENGLGISKNYSTAAELYVSSWDNIEYLMEIANEDGNPVAKNSVGDYYYNVSNYSEALMWYKKSAGLGYEWGQYNLAYLYEIGEGVKKDYNLAVQWYRKAAEEGLAAAQYAIGYMYEKGRGLTIDYARAAKWYRKAAKQGDINSMFSLSKIYEEGKGVTQDYSEAAKWYILAIKKEESDSDIVDKNNRHRSENARLFYFIAEMYYYGNGVTRDFVEAIKWYEKAAKKNFPDALYSLGIMYENGEGVKESSTEAINYYYKAAILNNRNAFEALKNLAEEGEIDAQYYLGELFSNGYGVPLDYSKALYWYVQAANMSHSDALRCVGQIYENGYGVKANYSQATFSYRKAVELGNEKAIKDLQRLALDKRCVDAQYNLGELYSCGMGVDMDMNLATNWFSMAAKQGYKPAVSILNELLIEKKEKHKE